MKDVKNLLQTAYFNLLQGDVPVYDNIPHKPTYPYIKLQEWTEVDDSDKSSFGSDLTFTVQIVDRYSGSVTREPLYSVANEVKQIIRSRPSPFDLEGFNVVTTIIDNENSFKELTNTHTFVYLNIRFRHTIEELQPA